MSKIHVPEVRTAQNPHPMSPSFPQSGMEVTPEGVVKIRTAGRHTVQYTAADFLEAFAQLRPALENAVG